MAKTTFGNGTVVTPAFLNAVNAHTHDGRNADGHAAPIIDDFIQGIALAINGTDAGAIDVTEGRCNINSNDITAYVQQLRKNISAPWAAGNNQGGLAAGLTLSAGAEYRVFVIYNPTTMAADVGFDTDPNAASLRAGASGYTKWREIGAVTYSDGTNKITGCCHVTGVDGSGMVGTAKALTEDTYSSEQVVTVGIERRGGIVTLTFPLIEGTSDANTFKITPYAEWPVCMVPTVVKILPAFGSHGGVGDQVPVYIQIGTSPDNSILLGVMGTGTGAEHRLTAGYWANSGTKRLYATTVTYHV